MNERELLEMIAEEAPEPSPHYIDEVIRTAARARSRRRIAMLAAVPALTGAAAALAITASPHLGAQARATTPARNMSAAPYAAAIRIEVASDSDTRPPVLYVLDHTCTEVGKMPPLIGCAGQPLASGLRHDLAVALRSYAPVRFVPSDGPRVRDKNLTVRNGGFLVILGPIRFDGQHADVPIAIERAALDGRGSTISLTNHGGRWVTARPPGMVTGMWIS